MGNLPCPMPADFKHQHSHLMYAIRMGKNVEWIDAELEKCRSWHESKGILRTNWNTVLTNWLRKAVEFELQQEAGRRAYGSTVAVPNGHYAERSNHSLGSICDISVKVATYHKFLKSNPKLAQEYLERQPARTQQAILRGMDV